MTTYQTGLFSRLANRDVITPYIERSFFDELWPDGGYDIHVDTPVHGAGTDGYFHPSTHAQTNDLRWLYYQIHPELSKLNIPQRVDMGLAMSAAVGSAVHAVLQNKLLAHGLVTPDEIEVDAIDEERHWRGRIDLMFEGRLVDIKTCTTNGFDRTTITPRDEWHYQLNPYMDYMGVDRGIILVVEIGWPYRMKELPIMKNPELLDKIYTKWETVWQAVQDNEPPKFCCSLGTEKMKGCMSRLTCWEQAS